MRRISGDDRVALRKAAQNVTKRLGVDAATGTNNSLPGPPSRGETTAKPEE
jgi:hypothetical protein